MLTKMSKGTVECLLLAEECRKHALKSKGQMKADYEAMEKRYLLLARSYEFTRCLEDFVRTNTKQIPE